MLKQVLTGASVLSLMFVCHLPAQAQSQAPAGKPQGQTAPQVQVSPQELQKFANAIKQLLVLEQEANKQMLQAIQQEGLSPERFNQIFMAQRNPQAQTAKPASDEENAKFKRAMTKVAAIEQQMPPKMTKAVQDQGLEVQQFEKIMAAVQGNRELRQQVQKLIKS